MVRIGDLLQGKGLVRASDLQAALDEQAREGRRLCSLLITRGALDFDAGARALGDQRGVPCALSKHLANRDTSLAALIPSDFGRASNALPIGRTSGGALIVAARDPAPALRIALERLVGAVTLVVAPATRLEHLIAASYGRADTQEFDIDVDSQVDLPPLVPPPPDVDMLDPDSMRLALSPLDDARVAKDPSQSGLLQIGVMSRTLPPAAPTIAATQLALERAITRDAASDVAIRYIAGRWLSGAIVAIREDTAIAHRGHGIIDLAELHLPLRLDSTIQRAIQGKRVATSSPASPAQDQLVRVLRTNAVVAAPIVVGDDTVAAIAVGDSIHGAADSNAATELGQLAHALGNAYARIQRT